MDNFFPRGSNENISFPFKYPAISSGNTLTFTAYHTLSLIGSNFVVSFPEAS